MNPAEHRAEALRWLDTAEKAYANMPHGGTLPVVGAAAIAQVHATLAGLGQVGRCGSLAPIVSHAPRPVCALSAGHLGWHRAEDGGEWGVPTEPTP